MKFIFTFAFNTLETLCKELDCQPGDMTEYMINKILNINQLKIKCYEKFL